MLNSITHLGFIGPGGPELIVVMLVLLLMFGAKDAPRIFRKINEFMNTIRNTADSFKREIMYSDIEESSPSDYQPDESDDYDEDYDHDEDYDYMDDEEDYSDETFMNLDDSVEVAEEEKSGPGESAEAASESGDDDVQKA